MVYEGAKSGRSMARVKRHREVTPRVASRRDVTGKAAVVRQPDPVCDTGRWQGEELAQETLAIASRNYRGGQLRAEPGAGRRPEALRDPDRQVIAACFIDEILAAAVRGRDQSVEPAGSGETE
jgi:hypothetical protein